MCPKISVIMPVFNGQRHLNECIVSILKQSFKDFEFIIINDGSTDKTKKILSGWAERDRRIKIITNKKNIGITKSLNKALNISRGDYIARQDADDISLSKRFERQVCFLDTHPEVKVLGTFAYIINKRGKIFKKQPMPVSYQKIKKSLAVKNPFFHPSVMMERKFIKKIGGYNEKFNVFQDYELWFRALLAGAEGENLPQFLIKRRIHPCMISVKKRKEQLKNASLLRKIYGKKI